MPRSSSLIGVASAVLLAACGADGTSPSMSNRGPHAQADAAPAPTAPPAPMPGADAGPLSPSDSAQTPAMGEAETAAWLEAGSFRNWTCEPEVHQARSPSPHGFNRICSNDVISRNVSASGEWPVGAAAVK